MFAGNLLANPQCKNFIKDISDNPIEFKTNFLPSAKWTYTDPGFDFAVFWDKEAREGLGEWMFKYTDEGNLIINKFTHGDYDKSIKQNYELISVDGIPVKSEKLYLSGIYYYYEDAFNEDREVSLKIKKLNNEILNIKTKLFQYYPTQTGINLNLKSLNYIDQINNKYEVYLRNELSYTFLGEDGLHNASKKHLVTRDDNNETEIQTCSIDKEIWDTAGSADPSQHYRFENIRQIDKDQISESVFLKPYSKEYGDSKDALEVKVIQEGNFVFNNEFNLKSFPFDRQTLKILIYDDFYKLEDRLLFSGSRMMRDLEYFVKNKKINGWDITGADSVDLTFKQPNKLSESSAIALEIYIERKHGYYIYKVIFPILLILMVCWSVVWVDPKELEARLTITIVCLLSLIAYNFVIDSELPKLEYLTVLDWIILISYIYATVPNFLSVISFRLQKTDINLSNKLEVISKRYGLSSYILSIFVIIYLNANFNPENSSTIISWMSGR